MASDREKKAGKRSYEAPVLTVYGSVRNLTGGSGGMAADAGGAMTMML